MTVERRIERGGAAATLLRGFPWPAGRALRVGVTGGIGSGKSSVAEIVGDLGGCVVDADRLAHEVVAPGSAGLAAVAAAFGRGVLAPDGSLDRAALAARVFADPQARSRLESITHPRVAALAAERLAGTPPDRLAVYDVPLLVEAGLAQAVDCVLVVDAPDAVRVERLAARGLSADQARARMAAQATRDQRRALAHVWVDNAGTPDDLRAVVSRAAALWLSRPAAA